MGLAGTGFFLMKKIQKYTIKFQLHNERLYKIRLKRKLNNIALINAYATTEDKDPKSDLKIILGDVNAKLGKEREYQKITFKYTLHEEANRNGELLCDFSAANNMIIIHNYSKIR